MDKRNLIVFSLLFTLFIFVMFSLFLYSRSYKNDVTSLEGVVLSKADTYVILQDVNHIIYRVNSDMNVSIGDNIIIDYTGVLDKNFENQDIVVVDYSVYDNVSDAEVPSNFNDNGIFSDYYTLAYNKLKTLSLDEKIGQLFLVRYPSTGAIRDLKEYNFGGFIFYEKDFKTKTKEEVIDMISELQDVSKIPLLTAVDEEGGKVVRVSSNPKLSVTPFKSSQELFATGDFDEIYDDTKIKSTLLKSLGLNLNLAPVIDVATNPNSYMYERTLGEDAVLTSKYAMTVIDASHDTGVSYTLKHFPGYGDNSDTHLGTSIDNRTYDDILNNDLKPFEAGIEFGAEAILVSHNVVNSIDSNNPASLSISVHNLLRNELKFTGIVMTDDLGMNALSSIDDAAVKAIMAGNDLLISTDYENDIQDVKDAVLDGTISEEVIDKLAFRVLAWKYYKGIMFNGK